MESVGHDGQTKAYSSKEWLSLFNQLPTGIVILKPNGVIELCNNQAKDFFAKDVTGLDWIDVIKTSFAPKEDDGHEISLKDGRRVNIAITSRKKVQGEIIVLTDITATRDFESERAKDRRLAEMGEMIAHLAHQIRTPLASAMLYLDNLNHPKLSDEKKEKFITKIKECHNNIEGQVRDLLFFAKGGKSVLEETTMSYLFEQTRLSLEAKLEKTQRLLKLNQQMEDKVFVCHKESLLGAMSNLVVNAINAGAQNIMLHAAMDDENRIAINVIDDGEGMDESTIEQSKRAFFTTRAKGTGLGLAVVDAVAKEHKGFVSIISKPGIGSTVSIVIPYIEGKAI